MSRLPVVDGPPVHAIRKGFVEIGNRGSAYADLDELAFVDEDLKVVSASFSEDFRAHGGLEAVAFCGFGLEAFWI